MGDGAPTLDAGRLHPWAWDSAAAYWRTGHFQTAVIQASIRINAEAQAKASRRDKSEGDLFKQLFSLDPPKPGMPRLRIMEDNGSKTYQSVHRGAMAFADRLYAAIRNPGSHQIVDEEDEQVALEQLAAFSVLARSGRPRQASGHACSVDGCRRSPGGQTGQSRRAVVMTSRPATACSSCGSAGSATSSRPYCSSSSVSRSPSQSSATRRALTPAGVTPITARWVMVRLASTGSRSRLSPWHHCGQVTTAAAAADQRSPQPDTAIAAHGGVAGGRLRLGMAQQLLDSEEGHARPDSRRSRTGDAASEPTSRPAAHA